MAAPDTVAYRCHSQVSNDDMHDSGSYGIQEVLSLNSPLIECSEGELLPNVVTLNRWSPSHWSLARIRTMHRPGSWRLSNDATMLASAPLTIQFPSPQWAYGMLLALNQRAIPFGANGIVVRMKLSVRNGAIGIAGVDSTMNALTTMEHTLGDGDTTVMLTIAEPNKTAAIVLRTTSTTGEKPNVIIHEVSAHRPGPARLAPRRHDLGYDLFVILSQAKTATQTAERTLLSLHPAIRVRRTHCISSSSTHYIRTQILGTQIPEATAQYLAFAANYADNTRKEIEIVRALGGRIAIISCTRETISRRIANVFQRMPAFIPAYDVLRQVGSGLYDLLNDWTIFQLKGDVSGVTNGSLITPWSMPATFFSDELAPTAGLDVLREPFDREKKFSLLTNNLGTVLLYRFEDIGSTLAPALSALTGRSRIQIVNENLSADKNYASLYREFLSRAKIPASLCADVYGRDPYMRHFYTNEEIAAFTAKWSR